MTNAMEEKLNQIITTLAINDGPREIMRIPGVWELVVKEYTAAALDALPAESE